MLAQRAASEGPRWTRAVEDQSAPIPPLERTSKLGRNFILGDGARSMRAVVKGSLATPLEGKVGKNRKDRVGLLCSRNAHARKVLGGYYPYFK